MSVGVGCGKPSVDVCGIVSVGVGGVLSVCVKSCTVSECWCLVWYCQC